MVHISSMGEMVESMLGKQQPNPSMYIHRLGSTYRTIRCGMAVDERWKRGCTEEGRREGGKR